MRNKKTKLRTQNPGPHEGQILPVAMIMGAVLLIFALAMVSMLSTSMKLNVKVNSGTKSTLTADGGIDKGINELTQGNAWGTAPNLSFTPIPGFKGDKVYTDIPGSLYEIQINPGNLFTSPGDKANPSNLTSPSGDAAYERTVSVDLYTLPPGYPTPSVQPTPWTLGGAAPTSFLSHRTVQASLRRGALTAAIIAGGTINLGGHVQVYWGDVYDYYQPSGCGYPCLTQTTITLGNSQGQGPGYPAFHTKQGCIASSASCAGCFGTGSGTGSTFCTPQDSGASNCQMYPNDPNMPPQPTVDLQSMKAKAQAIYYPASGQPGQGLNSGESGYFYYTPSYTLGAGANSLSGLAAGTGAENNHQYTGTDFGFKHGGNAQVQGVINRMQINLAQANTWCGNDDMVFYVDTTDKLPINSTRSNMVNGASGSVDGKFATFRGTFILLGSWAANGHSGSSSTPMNPPSAAWCPAGFNGNPDMNGFFYVGGDFSCQGTPVYYGSIDVEGSCSNTGNPSIYFRNDFKYNLIESGSIGTTKWEEVKYFPTPLP